MPPPATRARTSEPAPAKGGPAPRPPAARTTAPPRLAGKPAVRLSVGAAPRRKSGAATSEKAEGKAPKEPPDPRLTQALNKVRRNATRLKKHDPAKSKADDAQEAAEPPEKERFSRAQANKVGEIKSEMDAAKAPSAEEKPPQEKSFLEMLEEEIERVMPKKIEDTDHFMNEEDKKNLKDSMSGNIESQKQKVTGPVKATAGAKPDESVVTPKSVVTPMPEPLPKAVTEPVGARDAMPAPLPDEKVSLQSSKDEAERQFQENKITPEQLTKANDPRFTAVLKAKQDVDTHADAAPQRYRQFEQKTLTTAVSRAVAAERRDMGAMLGTHGEKAGGVRGHQGQAMKDDKDRRQEVVDFIERKFTETKSAVETKLSTLESDVTRMFDEGIEKNIKSMKDEATRKKDDWKEDRYYWHGVMTRPDLWVKDKLMGIDKQPRIKQIYVEAAEQFTRDMKSLVRDIARFVEARLKEAKDEVEKGRKEIHEFVGKLDGKLRQVGLDAEKAVSERFDELAQSIEDKKRDLAQNLAQRYKDAHDKAGEAIKEMQAEDKGLVTAFLDKLKEIIEILANFRRRVMAMLRKAANAIDLIVSDPIGFLGNLLDAIKRGVNQFVEHIWEHLKTGFMQWLFGSLAEMGITLPKDFSVPSILQLVLDVLGITAARIRDKVVKIIGERNMKLLEAAWDAVNILIKGGPAALWEKIKEYISNLKEMVVDAIQDWLITTIIKSAVTKLVMMFNPVGAIIQAIMMIYRTVMFFIENINRILDFVEAIIDSVYNIATGAIGSAADWIEKALARAVPIIIGFLARLLGLSGLTEKIRGFILKVQTRIDKAIDKVIEKIVGGIKNLVGLGKAAVGKLVEWWKQKKEFTTEEGHRHTLFFKGRGRGAQLVMSSDAPLSVEERIAARLSKRPAPTKEQKEKLTEAGKIVNAIEALMVKDDEYKQDTTNVGDQIGAQLNALSKLLVEAGIDPDGVPLTKVVWQQDGGRAGTVIAEPLTELAGNTKGSDPRDDPPGWDHVEDIDHELLNPAKGVWGPRFWRRMHLLNHNLHGPGQKWNLTPGRQVDNTAMETGVEADAKTALSVEPFVYYYRAKAEYYDGDILENFPQRITVEWGTMRKKRGGKGWEPDKQKGNPKFKLHPPPLDKKEARKLDLKTAGREILERPRYGISRGLAGHIQAERAENGPFTSKTNFQNRMKARYDALNATPPIKFMRDRWPEIQALLDREVAKF